MSQFMLVLYDTQEMGQKFQNFSPEEMQAAVGKYFAWAESLKSRGIHKGGNKLKDEPGKVMLPASDKPEVVDGPYLETKELVGGYFLIEAADYDEAVKICSDCPQLELGGKIELREIDQVD
ncbi:MAG: YciI family protein [Pirellulales bacterium]|nr:YciI family protein [Pirellulales bacterium]